MNSARINRIWLAAFELAARRPWLGTTVGLVLVAALIPILTVAGGYSGALGPSIPLFFLVPMLLASTLGGRVAGAVVSVGAVFCWDWFFIPPLHTVTIYYPRDLLALVIFLLDALLTGQLATVARRRAEEAIQRARTSEALYDLSVALIGSHDLARVLPVLTERLRETFDLAACAILLHRPDRTSWQAGAVAGALPVDLDIERGRNVAGILSWVSSTGQTRTLGSTDSRLEGGSAERRAEFWPLRVGERVVGVLELVFKPGTRMDAQRDRLLATLVNGAAIALEQDRLFHEEQAAAVARESDRLKSALLSSVSHDLRTPLAGIKAAATSLLQTDVQWSEEDRRVFLTDIDSEADRLTRLVSNLLDLSRIEAGAIKPSREWEDVGEIIGRVAHRVQTRTPGHHIVVDIAPGLPPVRVDAVHIEQALTNLIENAARYSPAGAPIEASAEPAQGELEAVTIAVTDRGVGIAPEEQSRIFDKFYRVAGSGHRTYGTGMGLAIVKGLVEANGGRVTVESEPGSGSTFRIVLPAAKQAEPPVPASPDSRSSAPGSPDR